MRTSKTTRSKKTASTSARTQMRTRPTPKWLTDKQELDEVARRRVLMVLSVLSGERAVTEVITEAHISRQMYYDLETRALEAMLAALTPASESASATGQTRLQELEGRLAQAERAKRRSDRLLFLTRKVLRPGTVKSAAGRPRGSRSRPRSTTPGSKPSSASTTTSTSSPKVSSAIPTKDGADGP